MGHLTTFEDFIKRAIEIAFWLLLLIPMIIFPIFFLVFVPPDQPIPIISTIIGMPLTPNDLLKLMIDPVTNMPMIQSIMGALMKTDFFKVVVYPGFTFAAIVATAVILWERKLLAKVHYRVGPLYAGRFEGILQPIADLFKLLFKEIVVPEKADRPLFLSAPILSLSIAGALIAVIPLGPNTVVARSDLGLLIVFAILGLFPLLLLIAAWASSNKFSFIGGLRALHQLISYEIPLILSVLGIVILSGSLNLITIVEAQSKVWFIAPQLIGGLIFLVATMAVLERIPFDLPEADSEIVAGWLTEYSGMNFGLLQLANYIKFYALSAIFTTLFLGGWLGPVFLPPEAWFLIKTLIVITTIILIRGSNPRVRIDQLIRLGWVWLILLSFANLFVAIMVAPILL